MEAIGKMKAWKKEENSIGKQTKDHKNHLRSFIEGKKVSSESIKGTGQWEQNSFENEEKRSTVKP